MGMAVNISLSATTGLLEGCTPMTQLSQHYNYNIDKLTASVLHALPCLQKFEHHQRLGDFMSRRLTATLASSACRLHLF